MAIPLVPCIRFLFLPFVYRLLYVWLDDDNPVECTKMAAHRDSNLRLLSPEMLVLGRDDDVP
jgi:hypothetical protein